MAVLLFERQALTLSPPGTTRFDKFHVSVRVSMPNWANVMAGRMPTVQTGKSHSVEFLVEFRDGARKPGSTDPVRVRALASKEWRMTLHAGEVRGKLATLQRTMESPTISGACATMLRSAPC